MQTSEQGSVLRIGSCLGQGDGDDVYGLGFGLVVDGWWMLFEKGAF